MGSQNGRSKSARLERKKDNIATIWHDIRSESQHIEPAHGNLITPQNTVVRLSTLQDDKVHRMESAAWATKHEERKRGMGQAASSQAELACPHRMIAASVTGYSGTTALIRHAIQP